MKKARSYLAAPRVSAKEQASLVKRLSFLIRSGMRVPDAIAVLETQTRAQAARRALGDIRKAVENGQLLSSGFAAYPGLLSPFGVSVVEVGEAGGTLSENLEYLAEELRTQALLKSKVFAAFVYPALIAVLTLFLTGSLILFIFPKILPIFSGLGIDLPLSTRIVLFLDWYATHWGLLTLLALFATAAGFRIWLGKNIGARTRVQKSMLRLPLIGPLLQAYQLGTLARMLSLLLKSGMPLGQSLMHTARVTACLPYRNEFEAIAATVERGADMASHLRGQEALFPELAVQMVSVGESSGTLSESLGYLASYYENELDELTKRLSSLVEPLLMIVMGSVVGFVAVSMITPLYEITQHLHAR